MNKYPILFSILNLLVVKFLLLVLLVPNFISCSKSGEVLPERISDLQLVKTISGESAKIHINKLHHQPVTENENVIGYYENMSGEAIVYITLYRNESEAKADLDKMTNKISPENSVFINPVFFDYRSNKIYRCFGMGMTHYVFVLNKKLYWISVDTHLAKNFFQEFYKHIE